MLVFGKHAPAGVPDADFQARLARAFAALPQRLITITHGERSRVNELSAGSVLSRVDEVAQLLWQWTHEAPEAGDVEDEPEALD